MKQGETLAIVGESGSGKSVTSLSIMGLLPNNARMTQGEIFFNGEDLRKKTEAQMSRIRGNDISMIFQEPMTSLNPVLTIGDQIMEGIILHKKVNTKEARNQAIETLKLVGFSRAEKMISEYPHQLSGGMRQRVMIAMAMATSPKLLIADEPTTALDVTIQAQILDLMLELKEKFHTSILLITHDLGVVAEMADRVVVMYAGKVVEEGTAEQLYDRPTHPYTEGLMKSIPSLGEERERLYSIRGQVPTLESIPSGCRFAPRCDYAIEKCLEGEPELEAITSQHAVRCFLHSSKNVEVGV
jgi:oligopeptide/dipeptide ABC transporter ATP-binding protein